MRIKVDVQLPEHKEYPSEVDRATEIREDIEYLIDQIELERNVEDCLCRLVKYYHALKRGLPKQWKQEFARRIEPILLEYMPDRQWQSKALSPKEDKHGEDY